MKLHTGQKKTTFGYIFWGLSGNSCFSFSFREDLLPEINLQMIKDVIEYKVILHLIYEMLKFELYSLSISSYNTDIFIFLLWRDFPILQPLREYWERGHQPNVCVNSISIFSTFQFFNFIFSLSCILEVYLQPLREYWDRPSSLSKNKFRWRENTKRIEINTK